MVSTELEDTENYLKYVVKMDYPNGVQYDFTHNDFDGCLVARCMACAELGLHWNEIVTEEFLAIKQSHFNALHELRNRLIEHAHQHNQVVQNLADKYDLRTLVKNKKAHAVESKAPPPKSSSPTDLLSELFAVEEELAIKKNHPITPEKEKLFEAMYKAACETPNKQPVEQPSEHRRISLSDEEE